MADILFLLCVIVFFAFKLKNSFGIRNEDDEKRRQTIEEFFRQKYSQGMAESNGCVAPDFGKKVVDVTNTGVVKDAKTELKLDFETTKEIRVKLAKIGFNQDNFLKGVETAAEMINEAFSNGDMDTLKKMLSKQVFANFKKQADDLAAQNKILKSSLVSVLSKDISDIKVADGDVLIDVILRTEQINFIENDKHEVIWGNKKRIETIKEKWTFSRSLSSRINFWVVENIASIAQ